jgi:hypothetical protein
MPLQNRVNPWGQLCAISSRGTRLRNRGILHDENKNIVKPWGYKAWVTCLFNLYEWFMNLLRASRKQSVDPLCHCR